MAQVSEKRFNPVERSQILTELIRKEERASKPSETFSVPDPRRLALLPAKPNATRPALQPSDEQLDRAEALLSSLCSIKHAHQVPTQIYPLPATSNMEYGFWAGSISDDLKDDPMFTHFAGHTDVTKFASDYVMLTGRSPFKRAGGGGGGGGGKK